jgi:hypothetical protein
MIPKIYDQKLIRVPTSIAFEESGDNKKGNLFGIVARCGRRVCMSRSQITQQVRLSLNL